MNTYIVGSGQTSTSLTLSSGDVMSVVFGGTAVDTTVSSGGFEYVFGLADSTTVSAGGSEFISSGGTALDTTVSTGGFEYVIGVASSTTVRGGAVSVFSGGTTLHDTVGSGGFEVISSGGVASSTTVGAGAEFIYSGGMALDTTLSAGGAEYVFGVASGTTVSGDGVEHIFSGGVASGTTLLSGGTIDVRYLTYASGGSANYDATTDLLTVSIGGQIYTQTLSGNYAGEFFHLAADATVGTDITVDDIPCYCGGTMILTDKGERSVEDLAIGDRVITHSGTARPIKWIGRRKIDLTTHPRPETVAPVRIVHGAFADNVPHTDLLLSGDHAVFTDGKLICARQLINGTTIRRETGRTVVDYFHVELDSHAVLLAAGLATESYLDTGNRGLFDRSGEPLVLHPDLTGEAASPAREAASCAPFVWDEPDVLPIWQRLAERAAALGQPMPQVATTGDAEPRVIVKGRTLRPLYAGDGLYIFPLPMGTTEVRLVSRASAPTDSRPWLDDRRCLGVYIERIVLRGASHVQEVPVDHPALSRGWWAVERNGTALRRWTNGDAVLPLPAFDGPAMLEVRAGSSGLTYVANVDQECRAA